MVLPRGTALPLADGFFDVVAGLPMHPLVVHVAVVILPLSALALIVLVLVPRARKPLGWLTLAGLAVGAVAAFVAKESGEALAQRVGLPTEHADYGNVLPFLAVVLLPVAIGWFVLQRRDTVRGRRRSVSTTIAGIAAIVLALATTVLTVVVGHTGATAAWSGVVATSSRTANEPDTAAGTSSTPGSTDAASTYTLADVAEHADRSSCWAAIDGKVYDLTDWIDQHPGGAEQILSICGTDATQAFDLQHQGQARPDAELANFLIGTLDSTSPSAGVSGASAAAGVAPTATATTTATATAKKRSYTMAQVRRHNSTSSCWAAIDGKVYNLTTWINRHPGGASRILAICGTDATRAFNAQHGGQARPAAELRAFRIGKLVTAKA